MGGHSVNQGRRQFLQLVTVTAASAALAACGGSGGESIGVTTRRFPQSVASGDPTAASVVLWTRLGGLPATADGALRVQVALDAQFTQLLLDQTGFPAAAAHDHCLRLKVVGLKPATVYFYRFLVDLGGGAWGASRTGRTKTAPMATADVPVRYAVVVCQDYIGRYYNTYAYLAQSEPNLDFILHIGDYIYETSGDPSYQSVGSSRGIQFTDPSSAITVGSGASAYLAASSVSNYRDLYQTYRSDPVLQRVHELYPMIAIWDDHEYSDDCWGATATYFNGLKDEYNPPRRDRAEQVYFEYMPVDDATVRSTAALAKDPATLWPNNTLYRRLRFGQNLEVALLDYRSYRPDHLIPEGAFPGKIVLDQPTLVQLLGGQAQYDAVSAAFGPYVDTTQSPWSQYLAALVPTLAQGYIQAGYAAAQAPGKAQADLTGSVSAFVFNQLIAQYNQAVSAGMVPGGTQIPAIDAATYAALPRGVAYLHMGKTEFFSELGSRYAVVQPTFDLFAAYQYAQNPALQDALGATQRAFLADVLASDAQYLNVISTVSTAELRWDLRSASTLPTDYQTVFKANVDQWDGFPQAKQALLASLAQRPGAFLVSGDIHASFVTQHQGGGLAQPVADFTVPAISSGTFNSFVASAIAVIPGLTDAQRALAQQALVAGLDQTLQQSAPADHPIVYADTTHHGFAIVQVQSTGLTVELALIDQKYVAQDLSGQPTQLASLFTRKAFTFNAATGQVTAL